MLSTEVNSGGQEVNKQLQKERKSPKCLGISAADLDVNKRI